MDNNEILTLLKVFQLVGARVVLFLLSFNVEGLITQIVENFVTLVVMGKALK